MNAIEVEGISQDERTETTERSVVLLSRILPRLNEFVEQKARTKTQGAVYIALATFCVLVQVAVVMMSAQHALPTGLQGVVSTGSGGVVVLLIPLMLALFFGALAATAWTRFVRMRFTPNVRQIGKGYLAFGLYPLENGSVLVDEEAITASASLSYPSLRDAHEAIEVAGSYANCVDDLPFVLSHTLRHEVENGLSREDGNSPRVVFDRENDMIGVYREISADYRDLETFDVTAGFINAGTTLAQHLVANRYTTKIAVSTKAETQEILNRVMGIVAGDRNSDTIDIDDFSSALLERIRTDLRKLAVVRRTSLVETLGVIAPRLAEVMLYGAYNFYCPHCHSPEIERLANQEFNAFEDDTAPATWNENARVFLRDWSEGIWKCNLCERETTRPIPVHKIYSQVLLPAYNYLLIENETDRVKIYSALNEKKIEYRQAAMRETEEIERENRTEIDEEMFKLRALKAQVRSTGETVDAMKQLMLKMKAVSEQRLTAIDEYAQQVQQEIVERNTQIEKEVQEDVARIRQKTQADINRFAYQARIEQQARDAVMRDMAISMRRSAVANESAAQNTGRIAENTNKIAKNTGRTAKFTKKGAREQKRIRKILS